MGNKLASSHLTSSHLHLPSTEAAARELSPGTNPLGAKQAEVVWTRRRRRRLGGLALQFHLHWMVKQKPGPASVSCVLITLTCWQHGWSGSRLGLDLLFLHFDIHCVSVLHLIITCDSDSWNIILINL